MTILCADSTHVYRVGSLRCHCGAEANGYPQVAMMFFPGYHPAGYRPPKPDPAPETSLAQLRAAVRAGASWLSADGKLAYTVRYGETLEAGWNEQAREFGAWLVRPEGLPGDAVKL